MRVPALRLATPPLASRGRRGARRAALALLAVLAAGLGGPRGLATSVAAPDDPRPAVRAHEDGSEAPAHGWTQDDGCPSRSGSSAAKALGGALERAWKFVAKEGPFEGEPLGWKERVFVVERSDKRRLLRVLSASSGQPKTTLAIDTTAPLSPCVGEGRVVVNTSPTTLEGLGVGDATLTRRWKVTAKDGLGPATLFRDEVYVVRDGVLERWAFGAAAPTWPKAPDAADAIRVERDTAPAGTPPRFPRPSLRGGSVFVTSGHELVEADRATGAERARAALGADAGPDARVVVTAGDAFVRRTPAAGAPETDRFARPAPGTLESRPALSLPAGLVSAGTAWTGVVAEGTARRLCAFAAGQGDGEEPWVVAGGGDHDEFASASLPLTHVPGAIYAGLRAFAVPSLVVMRAPPTAVASRVVPLRDRLLVFENPTTLASWREVRVGDDKPGFRPAGGGTGPAAATAPVSMKGCRAALEDGRVVEGPFTYDPKANVLSSGKPGEMPTCPARAVCAVLACDGPRRLLYGFAPEAAAAGVAAIVRAEVAKDALALAAAAAAAGDSDLARRALSIAVEGGAADAEVGAAESSIAALEASPRPRDDAKAHDVEEKVAALAHREADALVETAEGMAKDAPLSFGVALVRAAAEREKEHAGATKWVRARLPKEVPLPEPLALAEWLDFIDVRGRLKVRVWGMAKDNHTVWGSDSDRPSQDSPLFDSFWSARSTWPGEVEMVVFECGPLVVFSPLERPGSIVRCLALGRLVSDTLDKVFLPVAPPRTDSEKLILHLFSTRDQYLHSSRATGEAERGDGLDHTAGHYSPSDNITRIFFPDHDDDELSVSGVYSHELTHHWIERRRPTPAGGDSRDRSTSAPGYWVVEGFADFVRGFVFDVDGQKANPENPRADYADCLTGIAPDSLIPWPKMLRLTQAEFQTLPMENPVPYQRRWRLGSKGLTVPKVLFYDQGAAVCAWLYLAENGKHRKALLDFVYAYYGGKAQADTLEKSTGLSLDEIGRRTVAWCQELVKRG